MISRKLVMLTADTAVLFLSLFLVILLRFPDSISDSFSTHLGFFSPLLIFWLLVFYIVGYYDLSFYRSSIGFFSKSFKVLLFLFLTSSAFFYFLPVPIAPKTNLFLFWLTFAIFFLVERFLAVRLLRLSAPTVKAVFIGRKIISEQVTRDLKLHPEIGLILAAAYVDGSTTSMVKSIGDYKELLNYFKKNNIRAIIYDTGSKKTLEASTKLFQVLDPQTEFLTVSTLYEKHMGKVPLNLTDEFWYIANLQKGRSVRLYEFAKRSFDFFTAVILLTLTLPIVPILALLIKIDSPGPAIFRQRRVGFMGKVFVIHKFRTMVKDAEKKGARWAVPDDKRYTGVGKFLRFTHLDEIPQLMNILSGEMSFVGPRPERPEFMSSLEKEIPFYKTRLIVRPGVTGWAQLLYPYGSSKQDAKNKLEYDIFYLKNRSMILDIKIMLKTLYEIFRAGGR